MDWNQVRAFRATAEAGSFSAAARSLGLTQPTLSRQVAALEEALDVTLFERIGKTISITQTGLELLEHVRAMGAAADALDLAASGRSEAVEGMVSISASDGVAAYMLPPIVRRICEAAPLVQVEVVSSDAISDLRRREADIAIRHVRPQEPELIGKWIRDVTAGFYASKAWVAAHGTPRSGADAARVPFVGLDRGDRLVSYLQDKGLNVSAKNFAVRSENAIVSWELVRQGLGVGVMMDEIAATMDDIVPVFTDVEPVVFPIWLVTHRELRNSRRIRLVFDMLAEELEKV